MQVITFTRARLIETWETQPYVSNPTCCAIEMSRRVLSMGLYATGVLSGHTNENGAAAHRLPVAYGDPGRQKTSQL